MHSITIAIAWSDMDAFQHVNNTVYLKWAETARIDFSRKHLKNKCDFILARIEADYKLPVKFPNTIECKSYIKKIGNTSCSIITNIYNDENVLVCTINSIIVNFDYKKNEKKIWSDENKKLLAKFML